MLPLFLESPVVAGVSKRISPLMTVLWAPSVLMFVVACPRVSTAYFPASIVVSPLMLIWLLEKATIAVPGDWIWIVSPFSVTEAAPSGAVSDWVLFWPQIALKVSSEPAVLTWISFAVTVTGVPSSSPLDRMELNPTVFSSPAMVTVSVSAPPTTIWLPPSAHKALVEMVLPSKTTLAGFWTVTTE